MDHDQKPEHESTAGGAELTRRRFLGTSGRFLVYTSPVLTTLLTTDKAMAVSVYPRFVVEARTAVRGTFTGMPAKGMVAYRSATRTWTMQPEEDDFASVQYQQYFIGIEGSGSHMITQPIWVKISWFRHSAATKSFVWGPGPVTNSSRTVHLPVGGGTLGIGGTILDSAEEPWPTIDVDREYEGLVGTITFVPVGGPYGILKTLNIKIRV